MQINYSTAWWAAIMIKVIRSVHGSHKMNRQAAGLRCLMYTTLIQIKYDNFFLIHHLKTKWSPYNHA